MTRSLIRRSLVGLAIFAAMVVLGVVLSAGGDQGHSRPSPARATTATALSAGRSRPRATGAIHLQPNPRARRPQSPQKHSAT